MAKGTRVFWTDEKLNELFKGMIILLTKMGVTEEVFKSQMGSVPVENQLELDEVWPPESEPTVEGMEDVRKPEFDLEALYRKFPKKVGKKKGMLRLKKIVTSEAKYDAVSLAIDNYNLKVKDTEEQFIKQFDTFMSIWEDYADAPSINLKPQSGTIFT